MRVIGRLFLLSLPVLAVVAIWNGGGVGVLLGWSLTGYLIWRALPGIRADLRRLGSLRPAGLWNRGGDYL